MDDQIRDRHLSERHAYRIIPAEGKPTSRPYRGSGLPRVAVCVGDRILIDRIDGSLELGVQPDRS